MTVDVFFGKLVQEVDDSEDCTYSWCEWPGKDSQDKSTWEDDGTNFQYTIFPGYPYRPFSTHGYYAFVNREPIARAIHELCKPLYPNSNDTEWRTVDQTLLDLIDQLPEADGGIDTDRAKWYKYWSKRAVEEFGDEAVILIC